MGDKPFAERLTIQIHPRQSSSIDILRLQAGFDPDRLSEQMLGCGRRSLRTETLHPLPRVMRFRGIHPKQANDLGPRMGAATLHGDGVAICDLGNTDSVCCAGLQPPRPQRGGQGGHNHDSEASHADTVTRDRAQFQRFRDLCGASRYRRGVRTRLLRTIALAVALGILAALGVGLWVRSAAVDAGSSAERAAGEVLDKLPGRYSKLDAALKAIEAIAPDRSVLAAGNSALSKWNDAATGSDIRQKITAANAAETIVGRAREVVSASPKLKSNTLIAAALDAIDAAAVPAADVTALNRTVDRFQDRRAGPFRSLVASVFGIEEIPEYSPDHAK